MVVYLIESMVCRKQSVVVPRQNLVLELTTIKACIVIFGKNKYCQNNQSRICDWEITIKDHAETVKPLKQKELYWYHKLKTHSPFGPNERDVYATY